MNFEYDPQVDALFIRLSNEPYQESDEVREDVVFDYDAQGKLIGIELLNVSMLLPKEFQFKKGTRSGKVARSS